MVILASEDIGNADPRALSLATAAAAAVEHVGLPEARYALAQAAIYLALAPKSDAAGQRPAPAPRSTCASTAPQPVPPWLRSGPTARGQRARRQYENPHRHAVAISPSQELLPDAVAGARFYEPDEAEAELAERLRARSAGHAPGRERSIEPPVAPRAVTPAARAATSRATPPLARCSAACAPRRRSGSRRSSRDVAKVQPLWALLRVKDRARYMRRMAQAVIDDFDELTGAARRASRAARARRSPRSSCWRRSTR